MKKSKAQKNRFEKLIKLHDKYKEFKGLSRIGKLDTLPPQTLDEQLENVNPYYARNITVNYD